MIINTNNLPTWSIYTMIGGGIVLLLLFIWAIEYLMGCLTCAPCRKCYKSLHTILYVLCCCCLFSSKNDNDYDRV